MRWPVRLFVRLPVACAVAAPGICVAQDASIGNYVWMDANRNGIQDAGESGIPGVTVQLWNGAMNSLIASATTDGNGTYTLVGPTGTALRVRAILPGGNLRFAPKDQGGNDLVDSDVNEVTPLGFTDAFTLAASMLSVSSIDIGMMTPQQATLGNFVWDDVDEDGIQGGGEPGVAGVVVQLWNAAMNSLIGTATTGPGGLYALATPEPGSYRVRVVAPAGYTLSPKDIGLDDLRDSDVNTASPVGFTDVYVVAPDVVSLTSIDAGIHGQTVFRNGFE